MKTRGIRRYSVGDGRRPAPGLVVLCAQPAPSGPDLGVSRYMAEYTLQSAGSSLECFVADTPGLPTANRLGVLQTHDFLQRLELLGKEGAQGTTGNLLMLMVESST